MNSNRDQTSQRETNPNEKEAIRNVQTYLRHLSFHDDMINPVPIDGIWAEDTRRALVSFQQKHGLPPTGTVDRRTWEILKREYDISVSQNSPPAALALFPRQPRGFVLTQGTKGFLVDTVQYIISELERLYYFPNYTPSGEYDKATSDIIREFQRRNGITESGNVDRETWDALTIQHNLLLRYDE